MVLYWPGSLLVCFRSSFGNNAYRSSKWLTRRLLVPDPCTGVDIILGLCLSDGIEYLVKGINKKNKARSVPEDTVT